VEEPSAGFAATPEGDGCQRLADSSFGAARLGRLAEWMMRWGCCGDDAFQPPTSRHAGARGVVPGHDTIGCQADAEAW
jgi:hypothetical protein